MDTHKSKYPKIHSEGRGKGATGTLLTEQPEFCEFYCDVDGLGSVESSVKNRILVLVY